MAQLQLRARVKHEAGGIAVRNLRETILAWTLIEIANRM
jgi:hypothetical protein